MARLLRVEYEGAIYHVTMRGNERQVIFRDDADRERLLERLGQRVEQYGIRLYLFVFMTNHVHLVLETPEGNLSRFMHNLETGYTVYYNLRHKRAGHLLQGRFGAQLVERDDYFLRLTRYVHLNPVFVKRAKRLPSKERIEHLRHYGWSSYPSYIGLRKKLDFVEYGPMLSLMRVKKKQQRREYRKFVEAGIEEKDAELKEALKKSRLSIGSEEFRRWIWDKHIELLEGHEPEDVSFRHESRKVETEEILEAVSREFVVEKTEIFQRQKGTYVRQVAAKMLCKYGGLTQRQVAEMLKLGTGAAVCLQLKRLQESLAESRALRRQIVRIERILEGQK
ncbi:MAG: hypothetical protein E4H02_04025 [Lentisphaerales bacterium]|jgi:REP element-mobilizing transposase RayT|nr:MAG: hypothetical protein E4H02_04025 [Lentisphaerales bacterium]